MNFPSLRDIEFEAQKAFKDELDDRLFQIKRDAYILGCLMLLEKLGRPLAVDDHGRWLDL